MNGEIPTPKENSVRRLSRSLSISLVLFVGLIVLHQFLVRPALIRMTADAPVINIAGRQRMLSQKLAKEALELTTTTDATRKESLRSQLAETVESWTDAHTLLRGSDRTKILGHLPSETIRRGFQEMEPHFRAMSDAANLLLASDDGATKTIALSTILTHEPDFLNKMHTLVGEYEEEARRHLNQFQYWGLAILVAILGAQLIIQVVQLISTDRAARKVIERRRQELQIQLAHADRLMSMGAMAAALAHEINQPLGAIANYAEGCLNRLSATDQATNELTPALRAIQRAAQRGGEIIRRTREYARNCSHQLGLESVNQLVNDVQQLCQPEALRRNVSLETRLTPDLPPVCVDAIQIQQVLTNLVQNAFTALDDVESSERHITLITRQRSEQELELAVADSGPGLAANRLEAVFEPFVTTNEQGTGLGLSIARSIVETHGGTIRAESNPAGGAVFCFTLPVFVNDDATEESEPQMAPLMEAVRVG